MRTITFTEFRKHASGMFTKVQNGETLIVVRHGKPIAEISPVSTPEATRPSWQRPGLRLSTKGGSLSAAILEERTRENIL